MSDNITLPRALFEMLRDSLDYARRFNGASVSAELAALDAALAEPQETFAESLFRRSWEAHRAALAEPEQNVLRRDAERYRWLRGEVQGPHTPLAQVVWKRNNIRESGDWTNLSDGHALDEAIDAALDAIKEVKP